MERIYLVWINNKKTRNSTLIKGFYSSEMALKERDEQVAILKANAKALEYDISLSSIEVY